LKAIIVLAAIRGIFYFISSYTIGKMGETITNTLRCQLFDKLLNLPQSFFDKNDSGQLISVFTYNIGQINIAFSQMLLQFIHNGLVLVVTLMYLIWLSWELTLIFLLVGFPISSVTIHIGKKIRYISEQVQHSMGDVISHAKEDIDANHLIRSYHAEQMASQGFRQVSQRYMHRIIKLVQTNSILLPTLHMLIALSTAVVMYGILILFQNGNAADIIAYIIATASLPGPIRAVSNVYGKLLRAIVGFKSVTDILDLDNEKDQGKIKMRDLTESIVFDNVTFKYPESDHTTLKSFNLTIPKGETIAIVGPSGSGKSTLVSLIMRFYQDFEGDILIDGTPISDYSAYSLRSKIAFVNQNITLVNASIYDNIAYGELATKKKKQVYAAAKMAYVDDFVTTKTEGYQFIVGEKGKRLSGGQRQRIAIARAILKDAPILILDEATSALDRASERKIRQATKQLTKDRTTIIIAHRLLTVTQADRIIVLEHGQIAEIGTHQQLLKRDGVYKKLYQTDYLTNEQ